MPYNAFVSYLFAFVCFFLFFFTNVKDLGDWNMKAFEHYKPGLMGYPSKFSKTVLREI